MDYNEFKAYTIAVREKYAEYKAAIEASQEEIIPDVPNMEFIFRLNMMDHVLDELSNMENRSDE